MITLTAGFMIVLAACSLILVESELQAKEPCVAHDDLSHFICRYGKPDIDDSTENDRPRPVIVTRMLTYKKERVRATYIPDTKIGQPPPYKKWKLLGFQDPTTNTVLSAEDVVKRMRARDTKK